MPSGGEAPGQHRPVLRRADHDRRRMARAGEGERRGGGVVDRQHRGGEVAVEVLVDHATAHLERRPRLEAGLEVGAQGVAQEGRPLQRGAAVARDVAEDEGHPAVAAAAGRRRSRRRRPGRRRGGRPPRCGALPAAPAPAEAARAWSRPTSCSSSCRWRASRRAWAPERNEAPASTSESASRPASATSTDSGTTSTICSTVRVTGEPPAPSSSSDGLAVAGVGRVEAIVRRGGAVALPRPPSRAAAERRTASGPALATAVERPRRRASRDGAGARAFGSGAGAGLAGSEAAGGWGSEGWAGGSARFGSVRVRGRTALGRAMVLRPGAFFSFAGSGLVSPVRVGSSGAAGCSATGACSDGRGAANGPVWV